MKDGATLSGVRVIDTTHSAAGAFASRLMADFGADVVMVEATERESERTPFFSYLALGKRSVALNAASAGGRAAFERLLGTADVILRDGSCCGGHFDRYSTDQLRSIAPRAVITTVSATGDPGDTTDCDAEELLLSARSGWAWVNQVSGKSPLKPAGHQAAHQGGLSAFTATIAELFAREDDGAGGDVDVAMLEVLVATLSPALLQLQYNGENRNSGRVGFPYGPVRAKDGHFVLTTSRAHFWRDAMNALGLPELAEDARFGDPTGRAGLYEEVAPLVAERIGEHEKRELFNTLGVLRVSSGMVLDVEELTQDPHLQERNFFVETDIDGERSAQVPGPPFRSQESGWAIRGRAPRRGEHSREVLEELGLEPSEIERLLEAGEVK